MSGVAASLFVYGTLMSPNLINRVIGRVPKMVPAVLHNFHRYKIQDRPYPGIAEAKGSRVEGMFIESLDDEEFSKLDEYENIEYERIPVEVQLACNETERLLSLVTSLMFQDGVTQQTLSQIAISN